MRKEVYRPSVREGALRLPKLRAAAQGNDTAGLYSYCVCKRLRVCVYVWMWAEAVLVSNAKSSRQAQRAGGSPGATQAACSRTGQ